MNAVAGRSSGAGRWSAAAPMALRIQDVVVRFGGLTAVDVTEMRVPQGSIVGIVGANGAGKTTLFDVLSGFIAPERGSVLLDGEHELVGKRPEQRSKLGLGRSFQNAMLFDSMTVAETIGVAFHNRMPAGTLWGAALGMQLGVESRLATRIDELVDLLGLGSFRDKFIHELSTGTRRVVDLGCILAQRPRVLLLDEPSSGIAQREVEALEGLIRRVKDALGCTFIVIEHDIPLIRSLSDAMYAMETGRVIAAGTPDEVLNDTRVIEAYLGTSDVAISRSGKVVGAAT
jgi:ABC-type branched-subunit amino acid transport system ATPase component